ncbi:hypothetical protein D3C75_730780 [compost metagenome]
MEKGSGDNHLPYPDGVGDKQRPARIDQMQFSDDHVGGNQPAAEDHREGNDHHQHIAAKKSSARQRVRDHNRQGHTDQRAGRRIKDGIRIPADNLMCAEQDLEAFEGDIDRPEPDPARGDGRRTADGAADNENKRIQYNDDYKDEHGVHYSQKYPVTGGLFNFFGNCCRSCHTGTPFLPDAVFGDSFGQSVHGHQQNQIDE